ncbi:chemotaxis protein CheA [Planctomycetes bacterium Pla133]|uniref:histidine kinase n=2 Tax=Engelhardtia mirabilis TaxID=2528011 RepID=A0A518BMD0_9BACT|nr:Chemotaxis protein CheA [Planctomycetes bacterium Pla133]QDV02461.1 Chemotaxis protein CheA [Planctomycetes bacterium Pla86]
MLQAVVVDSLEILDGIDPLLRELEERPDDSSLINQIFRSFHTIKGNSGMAGLTVVPAFAHEIEEGLNSLREGKLDVTSERIAVLVQSTDALLALLQGIDPETGAEPFGELQEDCRAALEACFAKDAGSLPDALRAWLEAAQSDDHLRNHPKLRELAALLDGGNSSPEGAGQAETTKAGAKQEAPTEEAPTSAAAQVNGPPSITLRVGIEQFDRLMVLAGELYSIDERLKYWIHEALSESSSAANKGAVLGIARDFDGVMDRLYEQMHKIRMVSAMQLTRPLDRLVRELCRSSGKRIRFVKTGDERKLDKRIIEILGDPLVHMIRNSIDHGIEAPEDRRAAGKREEATIELCISEEEETIEISIRDDGRGINLGAVTDKAIRQGVITQARAATLTETERIELIYHPGLSTKEKATDLSGRGVGMDVVLSALRSEGGRVRASTKEGEGTTFVLELPKLGSPVVEGLAARVGQVVYMLPSKSVLKFFPWEGVKTSFLPSGARTAHLDDTSVPIVELEGLSGRRRFGPDDAFVGTAILLHDRTERKFVLRVDDVIGWQKALVVSTGSWLKEDPIVSGAFVLGNGCIGFMVTVEKLDQFLVRRSAA